MLVALWTIAAAQAQDCPATTADLARAVADADTAFAAMDLTRFSEAQALVNTLLQCLGEPVTPVDAAGVHRIRALAAYVNEDMTDTASALRSLVTTLPDYTLPESLAPEGTPLRQAFDDARLTDAGPERTLLPPEGTWLTMDGMRTNDRPLERPVVLQALSDTGAVQRTHWFPLEAAAPNWAHVPPVAEPEPDPKPAKKAPVPLLVASGAAAVIAGTTYGLAWAGHGNFEDPSTDMADLDGIRSRTNTAVVVSAVFGGVALGTGAAAVAVWTF